MRRSSPIYKLQAGTWQAKLDLQNAVLPALKGGTCDALWDGTNLFVMVFDATASKLYKLSYNATTQTYALIAGFPVSIAMRPGAETIVIAKDTVNRLYVTYEAESKIYVHWTISGDHKTWAATPLSIAAPVDPDDISTIVSYGGNAIGVAWSDQRNQQLQFRSHRDGDAPNVWQPVETVRSGFGCIDDHLNMKADSQGVSIWSPRTSSMPSGYASRSAAGTWSVTTGASGLDCGTRPILQIDAANNKLYVFYTRWEACVSDGAHAIEERVAYLDNLLFSLPTVVIAKNNVVMNEVQGTKQILPAGALAILCEGNGTAYLARLGFGLGNRRHGSGRHLPAATGAAHRNHDRHGHREPDHPGRVVAPRRKQWHAGARQLGQQPHAHLRARHRDAALDGRRHGQRPVHGRRQLRDGTRERILVHRTELHARIVVSRSI
jgi:hypothetical protein